MASKRANEDLVKRFSLAEVQNCRSVSRCARGGFEASERRLRKKVQCVETVALEACSCLKASGRKRGGLHVESVIDSYEEVILP